MEIVLYVLFVIVFIIGSFLFGRKFKKWWIIPLLFLAGALLFFIVSMLTNSDGCKNAIDESICGIGEGIQFYLSLVLSGILLACSFASGILSFIGFKTKKQQ